MREEGTITDDMFYWCEGMPHWLSVTDFREVRPNIPDGTENFAPPHPREESASRWKMPLLAGAALLVAVGALTAIIFLDPRAKFTPKAATPPPTQPLSPEKQLALDIVHGKVCTLPEWHEVAVILQMKTMDDTRQRLGVPNAIFDDGYRWVYFDRLQHPVTGLTGDLAITFDAEKNLKSFSTYP